LQAGGFLLLVAQGSGQSGGGSGGEYFMTSAPAHPQTRDRSNQNLDSAVAEAEQRYVAANPNSARLNQNAKAVLPGGNTRTTLHYGPFPLTIRSASGSRVTDVDGHTYVDFINEHTAGVLGHSNPVIQAALKRAIDDGLTLGAPNIYEHELAAAITARFPAMERLRFCNSGTEANLLALATARVVTGKPAVMIFDGAYHGSLLYFSHGPSPLNMPIPFIESRYNDAAQAVADIAANAQRLAAVLLEPMQGSGGGIPGEPEFLNALRNACREHGALLIFDEVMTSRLSPGGVQALRQVRPDMVTLGKYVGGGMTIGAFGGRAEIMARFDPSRPDALPHGGTFNNNVLAMAAGHAAFTQVLTTEAMNAMNALGDDLRSRTNALAAKRGLALQMTGIGSIYGLHFHKGPIRSSRDLDQAVKGREAELASLRKLFQLDMFARGLYVTRRGTGNLSLATTPAEVDLYLDAIDEFLANRGSLIREIVN
jgi:glutamate-1-semialdehyde 2,1-aminomutase